MFIARFQVDHPSGFSVCGTCRIASATGAEDIEVNISYPSSFQLTMTAAHLRSPSWAAQEVGRPSGYSVTAIL